MSDPFQATRRTMLGALSGASIVGISGQRTAVRSDQVAEGLTTDSSGQGEVGALVRTATQALPTIVSARRSKDATSVDVDKAIGVMNGGGPIEITSDLRLPNDRFFGPARGNIHAHDYATIGSEHITRNEIFAGSNADNWKVNNFAARAPGLFHDPGTAATATQMVIIRPFTMYLITLSVTTTLAGTIAFRLGEIAIPSSDEGFALSAGDQTYKFVVFSNDKAGEVAFNLMVDTAWSGLIRSASLTQVVREFPYDLFSIPNDRIDFANPMGVKFGRFMAGNIAIGDRSTASVLSKKASWNIAIGNRALSSAIDSIENTAIGTFSLEYNQAGQNTAGGYSSLRFNTIGLRNTGWGYKSLIRNGTGSDNSGFGHWSGFYNRSGNNNSNFGSKSGYYNSNGSFNSGFGSQAGLQNDGGSSNTYVGAISGPYTPQPQKFRYDRTTCIGAESKAYGDNTIAIGYQARCGSDPYEGGAAVAITALAIGYCAIAEHNEAIAIGGEAMACGTASITIGGGAGRNSVGDQTISIGDGANSFPNPVKYDNAIAIGHDTANTKSNQVVLGNSNVTEIRASVSSLTSISDRRDKTNIALINERFSTEFIKSLFPSRWDWQMRENNSRKGGDIGFIAQDILKSQQDFDAMWLNIVNSDNPDSLNITQGKLIPLLVSALKNTISRIEELEKLKNIK